MEFTQALLSAVFPAITAAVLAFAFGSLWYGPFFGKDWMKLNKLKKMKPTKKLMAYGFLRHLITAYVIVLIFLGVEWRGALITVAFLWLAFTAMPALADVIWVKRPWKLYAINTGYELASFLIMALVVTVWF